MTVRAKFFAYFRELFGGKERNLELPEGSTVRDFLGILCDSEERKREVFEGPSLRPHLVVMKNGTSILSLGGLDTRLDSGDVISVFPFLGGG